MYTVCMDTAMAALSITTSIVTSIVTVPGFGFTADSIEGGHDLYQRARSLLDQIADSCDARTCDHLTNSISAELDAIEGQLVESGYDRSHIGSFIAHLEASVKQTTGACQFFCVWGLEVGGDSVGVGGGELGEGLFPVGGGVSLDEAGVSCSFVGGFASVCEALGGSFVFDVADG